MMKLRPWSVEGREVDEVRPPAKYGVSGQFQEFKSKKTCRKSVVGK